MNDAIRIFTHAFSMVFRDIGATLRATWLGVAMIAGAAVGLIVVAPAQFSQFVLQTGDGSFDVPNVGLVLLAFLVMVIGYLVMVISWHRFVLLPGGQRTDNFAPSVGILLGYVGRSILLGLLMLLLVIPVFIPVGMIAAATGSLVLSAIATIPALAVIVWVFLRLSLILPACTISHDLKITESWRATKPLSGTIAVLTVVMVLLDFVINQALGALPATNILVGMIAVVTSVLYALVSASVLTTLYGIAVEGREI